MFILGIAERERLQGDRMGWSAPWGSTYPSHLRLLMAYLSESQWLTPARTANYRPPMPNESRTP